MLDYIFAQIPFTRLYTCMNPICATVYLCKKQSTYVQIFVHANGVCASVLSHKLKLCKQNLCKSDSCKNLSMQMGIAQVANTCMYIVCMYLYIYVCMYFIEMCCVMFMACSNVKCMCCVYLFISYAYAYVYAICTYIHVKIHTWYSVSIFADTSFVYAQILFAQKNTCKNLICLNNYLH